MYNALFNALPDEEKTKLLKSYERYFQTAAEEFAKAWTKAWHEICKKE